jgi:hypothetical protein
MNHQYSQIFLLCCLSFFLELTVSPANAIPNNFSPTTNTQFQEKSLESIVFSTPKKDQNNDCTKNCRGTGRRD